MKSEPRVNATSRQPWELRHTHLLDIAEQLFVEQGFAAVSLADIAHAAGVSKPIAYRHFVTKDGAYLACARRAQAEFVQELVDQVDSSLSVREQFAAAADLFFGLLESQPQRWELIYGSAAVLPAQSRAELAQLRSDNVATIYTLIVKDVPNVPPLFAESLAHAMSGAAERMGHWWRSRADLDRAQLVDSYVEIFYGAVARYVEPPEPVSSA